MVESWITSGAWYDAINAKTNTLQTKRMLLLWGMKDPMFGPDALARMVKAFPNSQAIQFDESGRFLIEEQAERVTGEINWFLMNSGVPDLSVIEQIGG